jgi:hypothetical protein
MRGEFIGVWSETWREIWLPLIDHEDVPEDIFCELFRELAPAMRDPVGEDALAVLLNDAIQLKEAFERSVVLAGTEIELAQVHDAFDASKATELWEASARRTAIEASLASLVGSAEAAAVLLGRALSEIASDAQKRAEAKERAIDRVINDAVASRQAFEAVRSKDLVGERALVAFLEAVHSTLDDLPGNQLSNRYFNLVTAFIDKFSLRYDLRRPCILCPTLPGVFASLVRDLRVLTSQDAHLDAMMKEFESAIRDLRHDCSDGRIKTCIQKQVNLLEAVGRTAPGVTGTTLGAICNQIGTWPHEKLKEAMKALYGFASDYPGIRHGGTPANAVRTVDMRDMVAMSILLVGFTPYLSSALDAEVVYWGA